MTRPMSLNFIIPLTFIIGLGLDLLPYPPWLAVIKPDWVLLILFYWCLTEPRRVGVGYGWVIGLVVDLIHYSLLGQHALGKAFVALVVVSLHHQIRLYHLWQQCLIVFVVATLQVGFYLWINQLAAAATFRITYWYAALATCLLWPVAYNLLHWLRHKTR